ncbi:sentrin-specific protease 2, putative [Plasmodium berghei]|uniref:Sentrin-specific protease 2, putative n=2 Tax=Plasmodium berghei TaxID=5821 RepID=A0A509AM72_PLABA|nr:sentrin-specific protease 2, putative [Plasmodium berghei ANKA]SCM25309.1 sentrin-specific protease 2, putative [Plasmodium berghei]SCN27329.1 sentrin-specific protease 2, putative [Plasmodium berghei]SCO63754.1 sentrin-specific protease 2, putative [Plasmodium berghei]VUC57184.1 sentrin-specific protease 2, putative [Plasmodium berghei ANKA]|eukprot:XP_034422963.1 sentrin-specific protease 2, putative [Plasmodium berghei ANKA]
MKNKKKLYKYKSEINNKNMVNSFEKKNTYKMTTNEKEENKTTNICDNELCEILSSDESNEFIYEKNDDFIIVELISYICGNSKILSFYPCTNNNSGKNKYLYHFYKKKKIKLYLCLNTKNNEVYIYQVQRKYVENKNTDNKNYTINKIPLYSQKSNESVKIVGEIKIGNTLQNNKNYNISSLNNIEIKKENKKNLINLEKKICITKLFDSVNCSYDISTVEYSKLENTDTQILDSLKSILEKKLNKNQKVVEYNIDSQKQNKNLIAEELDYQNNNDHILYVKKNDMIHKNSINLKSENKQDKTNVNNKEIKLLYLNFHEPAHIFMNHFFRINQDNEENSVKEITGFLKDEKYEYIEKEHLKKSKRKKYSPIFGKIKSEALPCNILENYQSDISICSTNLFFSDTEVITKENGGNGKVKEENGGKEEDKYKKNNKKNNIMPLKRNNLKIKWLLLNLNLKKEEEVLIQKYVMFKKISLQKMSKELHDHDISNIWTYQNKRKSPFRKKKKKKKKNVPENSCNIKFPDKTQDKENENESTVTFKNNTQQYTNNITSSFSYKHLLEDKENGINKTKGINIYNTDNKIDFDNACYIQNYHNNDDNIYILKEQTNKNEMADYEKTNIIQNIESNSVGLEKETNIKMSIKHQLEECPNNYHGKSVCYSEMNVLETNNFEKKISKKRKIEKDQLYCDNKNNNTCLNFENLVKNGKSDLTISESTKHITYKECNDAHNPNTRSNNSTDSSYDNKNNESIEEIIPDQFNLIQFNNSEQNILENCSEKQITNVDVINRSMDYRNRANIMENDENGENDENDEHDENEKSFFLKQKVNNILDIIKIIYTNSIRIKYFENLKLYIGLYKNYTNIEKTKLEFLETEKSIDIKILNWYINEKMVEKKNVWQLNNYKIDDCSLFRLNKFKYIDDSIIDFFNNYIYFYILNRNNNNDGCKIENDKKNDIYIFNTFFYKKIELYDDTSKAYLNTNRWIKKLNKKIYEYKYVFVPININNKHWSLVLIYFPFSDSNQDKNTEYSSNIIKNEEKYKKYYPLYTKKIYDKDVIDNVQENISSAVFRNTLDDSDRIINIDINLNSQYNKERNIFSKYRSKSLDSYFLNDQKYCIQGYNKNNVIKHSFKTIGKKHKDLTDLFEKCIAKHDEKKLGRKKMISGYLSDRNDHELSYISISDSSENCKNKKTNLSINTNEQNSKEWKNENNIEEEKLVYMIYLDSLFPSTKGNTILEKLKKYIEHLFHRDYIKKEKRKKKKNNNILSNSGGNSDSSSHTYHNNRSGNESNEPKIFFKFVYPNIIPKQNNTYDCGIYIIYFILHLCLNIHLIETDLINPFNKYIQTKYSDAKYTFNCSPQNSSKNSYAQIYPNNASPWFDHKDICTKRKQMKKMLLYMKDVINWKSEKHIENLNLLFLMNCNDKNQRN